MSLVDLWTIVRRGWIFIALALSLGVAVGVGAGTRQQAVYQSSMTVMMTLPPGVDTQRMLGQIATYEGLVTTTQTLAPVARSVPGLDMMAIRERVSAVNHGGTLLLTISAKGASPSDAHALGSAVLQSFKAVVVRVQAATPPELRTSVSVLDAPDMPQASIRTPTWMLATVGALGGGTMALLILISVFAIKSADEKQVAMEQDSR